jgi:hypothetical protein
MASRLRSRASPRISFFSFQDIITSVTGILVLVTLILTLYLEKAASSSGPVETEELRRRWDLLLEQTQKVTARNEAVRTRQLALSTSPDPAQLQAEIRAGQEQIQSLSNRLAAARQQAAQQAQDSETRADELGLGEVRERAGSVERELEQWKQNNSVLAGESASLESLELELRQKIHAATNQHRLWLLPDLSSTTRQPVLITVSRTKVVCDRFHQPDQHREFPADQSPSLFAEALRHWHPSRDYLVFYVRPSGIEVFTRCLEIAKSAGFQVGYDALEENREIVFSAPTGPPP